MTSLGASDLSIHLDAWPSAMSSRFGRRSRRALVLGARLAGLVGAIGVALGIAVALVPDAGPARPDPAHVEDAWVEVNRPIEIFSLAGTDFAHLPQGYRARRHPADGAREDIVTFGDPRAETPFLQLSFRRSGEGPSPATSFADVAAAMARDSRFAFARASPPTPLGTRFGWFEAADIRLVEGKGSTSCLAFRNRPEKAQILRIAGLMCGSAGRPAARDALGCVIDRVDLVSAGDDVALQQLFVEAERRRGHACAPSTLTSAGSRTTWLDANATLPVLRGSAGAPKD